LALAADGMENGEIAMRMGVSKHTVACHISKLLDLLVEESTQRSRDNIRIRYLEAKERAALLRAAEEQAAADEIDVESMLGTD
jgi:DNA-binding NarL/FixJ family response regulator